MHDRLLRLVQSDAVVKYCPAFVDPTIVADANLTLLRSLVIQKCSRRITTARVHTVRRLNQITVLPRKLATPNLRSIAVTVDPFGSAIAHLTTGRPSP